MSLITSQEMQLDQEDLGPITNGPQNQPVMGTTLTPNDSVSWPNGKDGFIVAGWDSDDKAYVVWVDIYDIEDMWWVYYNYYSTYEEALQVAEIISLFRNNLTRDHLLQAGLKSGDGQVG